MFKVDKSFNYGRDVIKDFTASLKEVDSCLDLGAGHGTDLEIIREKFPRARLHAIELYPPYIKELEAKGVKTFAVNLEAAPLPLEDESLDLIISNQVFEHVKEIFWIMHELSRVLKVGGALFLGVPNLASLHNRLLLALGRQPTCINNASAHLRGFTKHDLLRFVNIFENGYALRAYRGSNFYPFSPLIARPLARAFPSLAWGNFFLLKKKREYTKSEFLKFPVENMLETNFFLGK